MRYFDHPLLLMQFPLLCWSISILASLLNGDGGIEDIHTVFDLHRDMIGMCTFIESYVKWITPMRAEVSPHKDIPQKMFFLSKSCFPDQSQLGRGRINLISKYFRSLQMEGFWAHNTPELNGTKP